MIILILKNWISLHNFMNFESAETTDQDKRVETLNINTQAVKKIRLKFYTESNQWRSGEWFHSFFY
jgi:hypothetical protein